LTPARLPQSLTKLPLVRQSQRRASVITVRNRAHLDVCALQQRSFRTKALGRGAFIFDLAARPDHPAPMRPAGEGSTPLHPHLVARARVRKWHSLTPQLQRSNRDSLAMVQRTSNWTLLIVGTSGVAYSVGVPGSRRTWIRFDRHGRLR